jgi:ABC-2 type transport system permease protein
MLILLSIVKLLIFDVVFLAICIGLSLPFASKRHAAFAVFKRNILGYFNNPAGYVFLCVFVLLGSLAAFWPHEFFNANLANLDQLNTWMPFILLVFIPTITMSVWAEERRQGTDELLLTIPAGDWDIVVGKYLAAVGIFTISLLVSQIANFLVLSLLALGEIDVGLFATNYFGFWFMGLSMLALGMVASFFTSNLTIGFILGLLINAPFVFLSFASYPWKMFSIGEQMFDFTRGVISLRSVAFFGLLISVGLYLSAVLIGRRHWYGGKDGKSMFGHYATRSVALLATLLALTFFLARNLPYRWDVTSEQISSLSSDTVNLLHGLDDKKKVLIEAFISPEVPDEYARTKSDLITKLNEFGARGGNNLEIRIYDGVEPFSEEAARAEEQFGIAPVTVNVTERGALKQDDIFLGAAFTCGLEKVVVPFFDRGIPVEYELIRSICTASRPARPRLGVLTTDARLFGGFDMQRMTPIPKQAIVTELEKQYEVVQIDPQNKIEEKVDVLLAVQPSSLNQQQLDNFMEAVQRGVPTAIFEDPFPAMMSAPGTSQPKPPRGGMMGMGGGPPEPKGNIQALWSLLGINMYGTDEFGQFNADVVWQNYNPYNKVSQLSFITREWVFVGPDMPESEDPLPVNNPISSELKQLLFLYPGGIQKKEAEGLYFVPLVTTSRLTGTVDGDTLRGRNEALADVSRKALNEPIVLAAAIVSDKSKILDNEASDEEPAETAGRNDKKPDSTASTQAKDTDLKEVAQIAPQNGEASSEKAESDDNKNASTTGPADVATDKKAATAEKSDVAADKKESAPDGPNINVVFVADIDCMHSDFLQVRAQPSREVQWQFDNVTFVLNILDVLAGDRSFVDIRKRQTRHSTLKLVEQQIAKASEEREDEIQKFISRFEQAKAEAEETQKKNVAKIQKIVDDLKKKQEEGGEEVNQREVMRQLQGAAQDLTATMATEQRRTQIKIETSERQRDSELKRIERELDSDIRQVQSMYKWLAVLIPPVPPLILGATVFMRRRFLERESITEARKR